MGGGRDQNKRQIYEANVHYRISVLSPASKKSSRFKAVLRSVNPFTSELFMNNMQSSSYGVAFAMLQLCLHQHFHCEPCFQRFFTLPSFSLEQFYYKLVRF